MQNFRSKTYALCFNAVLSALFVALSMLAIPIGNSFKITFAPLPIVIASVCYGPVSGATVGIVGAFIEQLITYGVSATTVLWILPAGVRGLLTGLLFIILGKQLNPKCLLPSVIIPSLVVTVLNTAVTYIDSIVYGYPFALAIPALFIKIVLSVVTAVAIALISVPIIKTVSKYINSH